MESLTPGIVAEPIKEYGTRNAKQMELIRYFASKGLSENEVYELILDWYLKHTHLSKDWEQNPEKVKCELKSAISNWFGKKNDNRLDDTVLLPISVIDKIIEITEVTSQNDKIGSDIFSLQKFIFHLIQFYKSKSAKELSLPFNFVKKIQGASKHTASKFIQFCVDCGLIKLIREHNKIKHQNRVYLLNYDYSEQGDVASFETGLVKRFSKSDLYHRYTRAVYENIFCHDKLAQSGTII